MQYIFLIHGVQTSIGVFRLTPNLAEKAGTDGWISLVLGYILTTIASLIIIQVMKKYPNGTIIDLLSHYFGKWIGKIAAILFGVYFGFLAILSFTGSIIYLQALVFPQLSALVISMLAAIPSYLIARNGVKVLGRYAEFVFFMITWVFFIFLIPFDRFHWLHLLPILKEGFTPILSAVRETIFPFSGFEIAFFLYPFLQRRQDAGKGIVIANTITMVTYLWFTLLLFAYFSPDGIALFHTPIIDFLKIIQFEFVERVDIIVLTLFSFKMSTNWIVLMYLTVFCSSQLMGHTDHKKHLRLFLSLILIVLIVYPPSFPRIGSLIKIAIPIIITVAYLLPAFLWAAVSIRSHMLRRKSG